ncbi:hypothetical protein B0H15DRAFT_569446 [Mycena belliarum]|uniref:Uncharacterized protein n=1 Tax=Mycena belliarum TaxID=1033014 RepID=A0AAD6TWW4_9AGAR|nr:hypothetical protein B0H15DRAFT_569446 [Mycena belliae]
MATPSSSATSPSPTTAFASPLQHSAAGPDVPDQDSRKRSIEKFKARAEISNVTRSLRARLSYASYKATHNLSHVPLRDLEAQSQNQAQVFSRTMAAKRKASTLTTATYASSIGSNNYYNNPATQGGTSSSPGSALRRPGSMAPPPQRTYYPAVLAGTSNAAGGSDAPRPVLAHSLFTSILAPPPSQPARTILNVADPPVPPPSRPPASPRPRTSKPSARSIAEGTRAMAKTRRDDKPKKHKSRHSTDKGKQRQRRHAAVDADGDVDMKAAETLTSLLLHHRPSMGSASSPRSSLDDSESGSTQSYSHFAQSSARNVGSVTPVPPPGGASTSAIPEFRRASATPPPAQHAQTHLPHQTTPQPAPTDNEAADLMLFLATSPSPVRKDARDLAAYRALNGVRPKGRVLFPTAGSMGDGEGGRAPAKLARGGDSFGSSVSSIGGDMAPAPGSRTATPVPAAPSPVPGAQLLPPPPLPSSASALPSAAPSPAPAPRKDSRPASPKPVYGQAAPPQPQPLAPPPTQPAQVDFNFNEFLNASPSPRGSVGAPQKANLGLRADVGRKLFEEEQMRHHQHQQGPGAGKARAADEQRERERGLGAGIDLVQS